MSRDVRVLCRPASAAGFRLAGLPVLTAPDRGAAAAVLDDLPEDVAMVLVEDTLHDPARRATRPVALPFPGPTWDAAPDDRVVEILRRAIGYRVRLT